MISLRQLALTRNWPVLAAVGVLATLGVLTIWIDVRPDTVRTGLSEGQRQLIFLAAGIGGSEGRFGRGFR